MPRHRRRDIPRRNDAMSVVIRGAMQSLTNESVAQDTAGMLAFLNAQDWSNPARSAAWPTA